MRSVRSYCALAAHTMLCVCVFVCVFVVRCRCFLSSIAVVAVAVFAPLLLPYNRFGYESSLVVIVRHTHTHIRNALYTHHFLIIYYIHIQSIFIILDMYIDIKVIFLCNFHVYYKCRTAVWVASFRIIWILSFSVAFVVFRKSFIYCFRWQALARSVFKLYTFLSKGKEIVWLANYETFSSAICTPRIARLQCKMHFIAMHD